MRLFARIRSSDFAFHSALVLGGVASASVFNYLFYMLLGRLIGVESYGIVTSLTSALLIVGAPATVAELIVARLSADLAARGEVGGLLRLADLVTLYAGCIFLLVFIAGFFSREQIAAYFNLSDSRPVVFALIALSIFGVMTVQRGILQGAHRFGDLAASMSVEAAMKVVAGIALTVRFGVSGALIGTAFGSACSLLYNRFAFRARFGVQPGPITLPRGLIGRVISGVGLGQITLTVLMFYDVPLVKHIFDARSAGLYAAAALIGRAAIAAVSFVPALIMPKVTARAAAGQPSLPLLGVAVGISLSIIAIVASLAAFAPQWLVTLIAGHAFADAAPLVLLYVTASSCLALATVIAAYKIGLHRYDYVLPSCAVAVVEILVLSSWHPSLRAVVSVLAIGHACVLIAMLFRITATQPQDASVAQEIFPEAL